MRQVTATEKYRAVNEGKMAKGEFVRQMRMAYPSVISQWNSYNDTVTILRNRGYITEKTGIESYDSRMDLNISQNSIDRGVRYELQGQGVDPTTVTDKELVAKVTERVVKNLKKDPLHYINLIAKESSHVDKNDKMKETKRGKVEADTFNGMKKAELKENIQSAKENIIKVASVIRAKYAEIPGFNSILKDFLQTHQHDIKAGKVTDPIAEFDDYIDLNYDRLDEQPVEEGIGAQLLGRIPLPKDMLYSLIESLFEESSVQGKFKNILEMGEAMNILKKEVENGEIKTTHQLTKAFNTLVQASSLDEQPVKENYGPDIAQIFSIIEDRASDSGFDVQEEAMEVMEAIGQEFEIDFEFGAGPSRQAEAKGKDHDGDGDIDGDDYMMAKDKAIKKAMGKDEIVREHVKNIITKVLQEQMINEAATNELARLADDYAEFQGMKQSIIALQDIVTDIESFYDKTREKIQKVYDSIGEIRNEEGLKVGGFIAPTIEAAFNKDLRPVTKVGFTGGLETPKVKTMSSREFEDMKQQQGIEEEPKQTVFAPIAESKKKK